MGEAIINQLNEIDEKGFKVEQIIWDSESSIRGEGLTNRIKGRVNNFEIFEVGSRTTLQICREIFPLFFDISGNIGTSPDLMASII